MLDAEIIDTLIRRARDARSFSYAPYSNFHVGAALLCIDGSIYSGCNVENAAYSPGNCAERTAVFKAVSEGHTKFKAIAIVGEGDVTPPCGVCRQVLREFVVPQDFQVILAGHGSAYKIKSLEELLSLSFGPDNLI